MHQDYFGDSFDLVKRFFCGVLADSGLEVYVRPMFTGPVEGWSRDFLKLVGAKAEEPIGPQSPRSALLMDPDTGVTLGKAKSRGGVRVHVRIEEILDACQRYEVVVVFDQAFSRGVNRTAVQKKKLQTLPPGCFYYDSHAAFLFAGQRPKVLAAVERKLKELGVPRTRLIHGEAPQ